jgi:hypothetical protein
MAADPAQPWLNLAGRHPLLSAANELHLGGLVRSWQDHPAGPDGAPAGVIRRGRRARDRLVACNLRLVAHVLGKQTPKLASLSISADDLQDLLQAGAVGLTRAAEKYDPSRGYRFTTYATWWIWQGITRALERQLKGPTYSLDCPAHRGTGEDDRQTLGATIAAPAPADDQQLADLRELLARLPPIHRRLVEGRWGFDGRRRSRPAMAAELGISAPAAQRLLREAELFLANPGRPPPIAPPPPPLRDAEAGTTYTQLDLL